MRRGKKILLRLGKANAYWQREEDYETRITQVGAQDREEVIVAP